MPILTAGFNNSKHHNFLHAKHYPERRFQQFQTSRGARTNKPYRRGATHNEVVNLHYI